MAKTKKQAEAADPDDTWPVPATTTVKLPRGFHRDLWWLSRVTGEDPGKILERLCGVQVAASRKAREADIIRLRKLYAEEAKVRGGGPG